MNNGRDGRVSTDQDMDMTGKGWMVATLLGCAALSAQAASVTPEAGIELFGYPDFRGGHLSASEDVADLAERNFNKGAVSMIVHSGRWELCTDVEYKGQCAVYATGRYAQLDTFANRISSMRQVR
jgi:hypothetical protein